VDTADGYGFIQIDTASPIPDLGYATRGRVLFTGTPHTKPKTRQRLLMPAPYTFKKHKRKNPMYPNLKKQILSRLYLLRHYYERGYNKLVESYRDALPHTGKYDIFSGPFFERWLSENMTPEYIKYNIRPLIRDIAAMEKEANAYMFRRGKFKRENPMNTNFHCDDCGGNFPIQTSGGTGYAKTSDNKTICYQCAGVRWQEEMERTGKAIGYLVKRTTSDNNSWYVIDWPGTISFKVREISKSYSYAFGRKIERRDAWFIHNREIWHCISKGDMDLCRCRRTKQRI
jgi:hypothetical protein